MENKTKQRESNFELLRIITMILIFLYHFTIHGKILHVEYFTPNKLLSMFFGCFGKLGVNIFILLMGYFLIDSKFKLKRLLKMILFILFYSVGLYFVALKVKGITMDEADTPLLHFCFPIHNTVWWFMTDYIYVYLLTPFLNKGIKALGKKSNLNFIIIFGILFCLIADFTLSERSEYSQFITYIFVYIIGAYLKLYNINFKKKWIFPLTFAICSLALFASYVGIAKHNDITGSKLDPAFFLRQTSTIVMIASVSLFMTFKNIHIKNNKVINYIAKCSTATYLISDHDMLRRIFWDLCARTGEYVNLPFFKFVLYLLALVITIFAIAIVLETIRVYILEKLIFKIKLFEKPIEKFDNWINA